MTIVQLLFSYSVQQKGYFHPFPLTVGISSPLISLLSCSFTLVAILCSNISIDLYISLWYKINLISVNNSLIIYGLRSKVLVESSQCLLAQTHRTLTRSPITFSIRFSSSYKQGWHWRHPLITYYANYKVMILHQKLLFSGDQNTRHPKSSFLGSGIWLVESHVINQSTVV